MTDAEVEKLRDEYKKVVTMLLAEIRRNGLLQQYRFGDHGLGRKWLRDILAEVATDAREGGISIMEGERLIIAWAIGDRETLETWAAAMKIAGEEWNRKIEMENGE